MDWQLTQKNAFKTALGVTLAYVAALALGWQNPVWAAFAVFFPRLPCFGLTVHKSVLRMIGTLAGSVVAAAIIGTTVQNQWLSLASISAVTGFWFFLARRSTDSYALLTAGFTGYIIWSNTIFNPENTFTIASYRVSETCLGIVIGTVIGGVLWPDMELPRIRQQMEVLRRALQQFVIQMADALDGNVDATQTLGKTEKLLHKQLDGIEALFVSAQRNSFLGDSLNLTTDIYLSSRRLTDHFSTLRSLLSRYPQLMETGSAGSIAAFLRSSAAELDGMDWADMRLTSQRQAASMSPYLREIDNAVSRAIQDTDFEPGPATLAVAARDHLDLITAGIDDLSERLSGTAAGTAGRTQRVVGTLAPPATVSDDVRSSVVTALVMFAAGAFWFCSQMPAGGTAFVFAGTTQIALIVVPIIPYRAFFSVLFAAIAGTFAVVFLVLPRLDGVLELSFVIFLAVYLMTLIQEIPGKQVIGVMGFAVFVGLLMIQVQQQNYATLLPAFISATIAQVVGAHIGLGVTMLLLPKSPGRQLSQSVQAALALASNSLGAASDVDRHDDIETELDQESRRLRAACDRILFWHAQLLACIDKSDADAIMQVAHELEVTVGCLSALKSFRVAHVNDLSEQGRQRETELRDALVSTLDSIRESAARGTGAAEDLLHRVDQAAAHVLEFARQQSDREVRIALSLVGHYRAVAACLMPVAAAMRNCNSAKLSQNRF